MIAVGDLPLEITLRITLRGRVRDLAVLLDALTSSESVVFLAKGRRDENEQEACLTPQKNSAVTPETAADEVCTTRAHARRGNDRRLDLRPVGRLLRAARQERALGNPAVLCRPGSDRCGMGVYPDHFRGVARSRKAVYEPRVPAAK